MKKQKLITRLLPFIMLVALVLTGCKDEPEIDFGFSEDISTEGFKFGPDGGYGNMDFRAPENSSPKVSVEMIIILTRTGFRPNVDMIKAGKSMCASIRTTLHGTDMVLSI